MPGQREREKCGKNAGKMFSALHAEMMFACGKNVFYIIERHRRKPLRGPGGRARPGGRRHGLAANPRPAAETPHGLTAERQRPAAGRIMHRNQEPVPSLVAGRSAAIMHRNQVSRQRLDRPGSGARGLSLAHVAGRSCSCP